MIKTPKIRIQVLIFTFIRLVINTSFRMVYPFLPHISRGLNITLSQAARALSIRSIAGIFGPFVASVADSRGRKTGMLLGLFFFITGMTVVVFWPTYLGLIISFILTTLGKFAHDPSMQAYLSDQVPYERRGAILAFTEMGWSGSYFLGVPLVSFMIARAGWLAPFPLLAIMGVLGFLIIFIMLPKDPVVQKKPNMFKNFGVVFSSGAALAGLAMTLSLSLANEVVNLVFGVWLEDSFGLQVAALGLASLVIGLSEFSGESLVSLVSDRIGKKQAIRIGLIGTSLASVALPFIAQGQISALVGLFIFYFFFEFTFVSTIPLMTEVLPQARATFMAVNIATTSVGRAIAAWVSPVIFANGFTTNAIVSAVINLFALLALQYIVIPKNEIQNNL